MSFEYLAILALIAALSIVQSVFGMGILVFGTPTLLLAGYDFITTLGFLLPASFAISLFQVIRSGPERPAISRSLYFLCLPGVVVGLWLVDDSPLAPWTNLLVGGTLVATAIVRFWPRAQMLLKAVLQKHLPGYHLFMGGVHGMTNLGGALLAILASATSNEKEAIRYTVAHYYLAFSIVQMLLLATFLDHADVLSGNLVSMLVSTSVYFLVGNRIFKRSSDSAYNTALTIFIAAYGAAVLIRF